MRQETDSVLNAFIQESEEMPELLGTSFYVMKTYQVFGFKESRETGFWFFFIGVRNWMTKILIFSLVVFNTGCGVTESSTSKTLVKRSSENKIEEHFKELRFAKELTLETEISSQVIISRGTLNHSVDNLRVKLKILPMIENRQNISSLEIIPPGKIIGLLLEYNFDTPSPGLHEFGLKMESILRHEFYEVRDKIPFPLQGLSTEQIKYTKPSLTIDSDDDKIHRLASSIAQGEDDLYRVVFKVSKWVNENVQSHIDNSTILSSQKASWVLENRKGVCDEISNLFIGLLRSLGIPSKFITGLVSFNYNGTIFWKPHGWAEVYFPIAGWIPFDVAYNQLGFIDATHMKFTESVDASDPTLTSYEWTSVNTSDTLTSSERTSDNALVSTKDLQIRTKIKKKTGTVTPLLEIKPKVWYPTIGVGSHNVVEATIVNPHNFYVITDISLHAPHSLEIMERNTEMILMDPGTRKILYWIVKPTIVMEKGMIAVCPIDVVSSRNASSNVKFSVEETRGYPKYSFERLKKAVNKRGERKYEVQKP